MMLGQKPVVPFPSPGMNPRSVPRNYYMNPQQPIIESQPPQPIANQPPPALPPTTPAKRRGGKKKSKESKNQSQ